MNANPINASKNKNIQPPPYYILSVACPLCGKSSEQILVRPRRVRRAKIENDLFQWVPIWTGTKNSDQFPNVRPFDLGVLHCPACGFTETQQTFRSLDKVKYPNARTLKQILVLKKLIQRDGPLRALVKGINPIDPTLYSAFMIQVAALAIQMLPHPEIRDFTRIGNCAVRIARFHLDRLHYGGPCWETPESVALPAVSPLASAFEKILEDLKPIKEAWSLIPQSYNEALKIAIDAFGVALDRGFPGETSLKRIELSNQRAHLVGETGDHLKAQSLLEDLVIQIDELKENWESETGHPKETMDDLDHTWSLQDQLLKLDHFRKVTTELLKILGKRLSEAA
ncbi:MAG: DUF2225 domain-containing protein [Candidatus Eisenbacteria bacterium]|uniref:DUF2225 domain-containing protein n=1 Tax=Eiseniibacteriota bacterium TaxID=2212470 RepID=A0A948W8X2_UNCEI|nr:DUF2225 domain-containing protein [Candidatus Eisenbacteria bacterium]MBU1947378.1 DUF2225 domain-containing protein [Candidatus Eisenbacteria bacterium]MBU2693146.1 DUF2225 domain-containing protein [Candidatus Eisenbacteria bacterium]